MECAGHESCFSFMQLLLHLVNVAAWLVTLAAQVLLVVPVVLPMLARRSTQSRPC